MDNDKLKSFQEKLQVLRQTYVSQLPDKLSHINSLWELVLAGQHTESDLQDLRRAVHSLAGSGATFGYSEITEVAKGIEAEVKLLSTQQGLQNMDVPAITNRIDRLAEVMTLICLKADNEGGLSREITGNKDSGRSTIVENSIYVIEDDEEVCEFICSILGDHGFHVEKFYTTDALLKRAIESPPEVVIADIILRDNDMGGIELAYELQEHGIMCPMIAITIKNDIDTRIQASKAGIKYFFTKPLDSITFINTVSGLINPRREAPYRALIVDDDETLAEYYSLSLKKSGLQTYVLTDPREIIKVLGTFNPEIILMDIYMPGYSGTDLALAIRQSRKYDNVPIVFLSQESDFWKKTSALHLGGDDFITKPVMPEHLSITVLARVKRARQLSDSRKRLEDAIKELERYKLGLDEHAIVSTSDSEGKITYANSKFQKLSGYSMDELFGQNHNIVNSGYHPKEFFGEMWSNISSGKVWKGVIRNKKRTGDDYWVETTIVPYLDSYGIPYQYMAIRTDITEQVNAKIEAEKANRAKSDFLSSMSHELRTPLNAILGFSHLLEIDDEGALSEVQKENIHEISKAGDHLLYLINEILDLSKIEAGKMDVSFEPVDINELVYECRDLVIPASNELGVTIETKLDNSADKYVLGDRVRVKQAILNLLSNAVKYNKAGGSIDIYSELQPDGKLRLSITDTGIGIAADKLDQLFEPFNRLGLKSTENGGTGIGLVITKRLTEIMGGDIGVHSTPGEGSTFWFQLPVTGPINDENTAPQAAIQTANSDMSSRQFSLLYIEDNPSNVKLVEKLLGKRNDIAMCAAYLPQEGLDIAEKILPDLILLDINLPGMDGYSVLRILKDNGRTRHIPVIALSANAMPSDVKYGLDAGFDYYLTKPVNVKKFFSTIDSVISERLTDIIRH